MVHLKSRKGEKKCGQRGSTESLRLRQCACSNDSSPNPAGLVLNEHVIKPDSLNVADNGGLTEKPFMMALGLVSTACTGFLGP